MKGLWRILLTVAFGLIAVVSAVNGWNEESLLAGFHALMAVLIIAAIQERGGPGLAGGVLIYLGLLVTVTTLGMLSGVRGLLSEDSDGAVLWGTMPFFVAYCAGFLYVYAGRRGRSGDRETASTD